MLKPAKIRLEAMSVCQLRCPSCPTTTGEIRPTIASGYLKAADFARLLDENPRVRWVELSNFGEILLNPDFVAILEHAHTRGVALSADNGLNLNTATDAQLEAMVRFGFKSATISIDGASPESYRQYRIGGDFDAVIANVRKLNALKASFGRADGPPHLVWQFIVFGHNEHEIPIARRMAAELGMEFRPKLSYDDDVSPLRDKDAVRRELSTGVATREEHFEKYGEHYARRICHGLWTEPQINWDGTMLGCCINYWGDFGGNAFRDGLAASVNGEKMQYAREMLLGKRPARDDIPCSTCQLYTSMHDSGRWLNRSDVDLPGRRLRAGARALYRASGMRKAVRGVLAWCRLRS